MKALVVRPDGFCGVLLAGPAVRAVATRAAHVTVMCEPDGAPAARLLPHVDDVLAWDAPWEPPGPDRTDGEGSLQVLREACYDVALVLAAQGRSPLPTAQLLRRARVRRIGADGADGDDGLLDVGHRRLPGQDEAAAALDTAAAMGFLPRAGDDGRLRVIPPPDTTGLTGNGPYVVVHPGADAWTPDRCSEAVAELADAGHRVVVTGGPEETALTRYVSGATAVDLGGRTDPRRLTGVLHAADAVVAGAPGAAHLAAATGTPVVSLVPQVCLRGVPGIVLGQDDTTAPDVASAVRKLLAESA
ncbi:glycosyltransferase family 9 protein [Streptomyces sp. KR55]|uniref:glycosyltransferase family 9 protein n=1 Tax=Streptomyces sp. KR55 TaxID=3457425 RepID=UPI003FD083A9